MALFLDLLRSIHGSSPQYLVHISNPFGDNFYLNNSKKIISDGGNDYLPTIIKLEQSINDKTDSTKNDTVLKISSLSEVGNEIYTREDMQKWEVFVYGYDKNATDTPLLFRGDIASIYQSDLEWISIGLSSYYNKLQKDGLTKSYTNNCRHSLYTLDCGVVNSSYAESLIGVAGTDGRTIVIQTTKPDGYYNNGYVRAGDTGYTTNRITKHVGNTLTFATPFKISKINNKIITVYAGCDKSTTTCLNKFNNLANFGGFPRIPKIAPNKAGSL